MSVLSVNSCTKEQTKLSMELDTIFDKFLFPIKTELEMQKLEDYLLNKEHANKFLIG